MLPFILFPLSTIFTVAVAAKSTSESEALAFLQDVDNKMSEIYFQTVTAHWKYYTNITKLNQQLMVIY